MTTFEIIALLFFTLLLGIVIGVIFAFKLLSPQEKDEIEKDEWERGDY